MRCNYPGDLMQHFLLPYPHIVGPDTAGGYAVATAVSYDREANATCVSFRPMLPSEVTLAQRDADGNRRLRECGVCSPPVNGAERSAYRCVPHHPPVSVGSASQIGLWVLENHGG
jgi:hypothetical protein